MDGYGVWQHAAVEIDSELAESQYAIQARRNSTRRDLVFYPTQNAFPTNTFGGLGKGKTTALRHSWQLMKRSPNHRVRLKSSKNMDVRIGISWKLCGSNLLQFDALKITVAPTRLATIGRQLRFIF